MKSEMLRTTCDGSNGVPGETGYGQDGAVTSDQVIAACARRLLGRSSAENAVQDALADLGDIMDAQHVVVFQIESYHAEDMRPKRLACTLMDRCPHCGSRYGDDYLRLVEGDLRTELEAGRNVSLTVDQLTPELQQQLKARNVKRLLIFPLTVLGSWWGGLVVESQKDNWPTPFLQDGNLETVSALFSAYYERLTATAGYQERDKLSGALEMAGTVCHKLNQPMQVILGYASMVTSGDINEPDQIADVVKLIEDETRQMGIITKNLMGITKNHGAD